MSFEFAGDQLEAVHFAGDDLEKVYFNGDLVFEKMTGPMYEMENPTPIYSSTSDGFVLALRGELGLDGEYTRIRFYGGDGGAGAWGDNYLTLSNDGNSVTGESLIRMNGYDYGLQVVNGTLRPMAGGSVAGSGITVAAGQFTGSVTAQDFNGNQLRVYGDSGALRVSFTSGSGGGTADPPGKLFVPV